MKKPMVKDIVFTLSAEDCKGNEVDVFKAMKKVGIGMRELLQRLADSDGSVTLWPYSKKRKEYLENEPYYFDFVQSGVIYD